MFCDRCEETARGCACTASGVCGKNPETAGLRDVLIRVCRGLAYRNLAAGGQENPDVGLFIAGALFGTLTNVDFDPGRIRDLTREAIALRDLLPPAGTDDPEASTPVPADDAAIDDDVHSLRTLLLAGLRGLAANYCHAASLGYTDETVTEFLQRALASGLRELTADELVGLAKECGTVEGHDPRPPRSSEHPDLRPPRDHDRADDGRRPAGDPHGRPRARRPQAAPRADHGVRPPGRGRDRGLGGRGDQERGHPAVRGHGRLRRAAARAGVLHRVRPGPAAGHGDPDRGLREVPVQRARPRHGRRHPPSDRRGPMQRQLPARGDCAAARRRLRGRDQRPGDLVHHRVVRADGRAGPARPAQRRGQGHPPRAAPARGSPRRARSTCSSGSPA